MKVDSLDRSILSVLRDSGRASFVEIAERVGVTERTIRTRMKRLEEDGVIRGYTIRETGIGLTALIRMKVGRGLRLVLLLESSRVGRVLRACTKLVGMQI